MLSFIKPLVCGLLNSAISLARVSEGLVEVTANTRDIILTLRLYALPSIFVPAVSVSGRYRSARITGVTSLCFDIEETVELLTLDIVSDINSQKGGEE